MKLVLIGVVVALLCVQAIQASTPREGSCERKFSFSVAGIRRWFRQDFKKEHDIAHADLVTTQNICDQLTQVLNSFEATPPTTNEIDNFITAFYPMHLTASEAINHLRYECDVLLQLINQYVQKQKAVCNANSTSTGCEAKTNKLYCDLNDFNAVLIAMAAAAKEYSDQLLVSCDGLYKFVYDYDAAKYADADKQAEFAVLLGPFKDLHDIAHTQFSYIKAICDQLTLGIEAWSNRQ